MARASSIVATTAAVVLTLAQFGVGTVFAASALTSSGHVGRALADRRAAEAFTPNATIAGFAERTAMSERGRALYYASSPSVEPTAGFNDRCGYGASDDIVLGCYTGTSIYISDVTNPDLDGVRDVTAAHEMLHAAWVRLDAQEQAQLGDELEAVYATLPQDGTIAERLELYRTGGLGERVNELHSILGTEVADLPPALEEHYAEFFDDRSVVVALNARYEAVFTDLENRIEDLVSRIETMYADLTARIAANTAEYDALNVEINGFNSRADSGDFGSTAAFEAERADLLARSQALDATRAAIDADIAVYDGLRSELEGLNSDAAALNKSVESQ
ncbi:hypothetical protein C5C31_07470 [Rathayibacter rathayi]|uniref:Uncharacterized protein n=1 Tax=Rathayibacter rathayi TaxID=33887 RepID=A0ABD6W8A9_RATRA|nr:hypothetical protein [Rathayibacter rathayi]PPF14056.1 hypothetical protein C5C04_08105 [Rathayibacter rathayi]PPF79198.1 hypothetical protein C5C14_09480 [Rathayibacter rathayi]PPG13202.1 hypothetical protein C5C11_07710 [Rathayibacter rathayi]PPG43469.1 hypothetical protein C5C20_08435 [Rathayibacter rathayi]PPH23509.1 hypothetical protein C5C31_07470 [Rathayibacter rathayi]